MTHDDGATGRTDRLDLSAITEAANDTFTVRRVFGDPYEQDGALIVPVAVVTGVHGRAGAGGRGRFDGDDPGHRPHPHGPQADLPGDAPAEDAPVPETESTADTVDDSPARDEGGPRGIFWGGRCHHGRFGHGHHPGHGRGAGRAAAGAFATHTRPLGVYVVRDGKVSWQPAVDVNRAVMGGQLIGALVGTALALTVPLAWALRRRPQRG